MDKQQTNGISRRSFFKVALGSIVTLPAVAGGFLLPIDGPLGPGEALAEGEQADATTTVVIAQAYEAGIFVVDTRGGAMSPVPNAKVTIFSHYNQKTISGTTNDKGLWLADIREVAKKENIHGVDRYSFYARMDIEAAGYRLFRSRRMGIDGAKGFQVPTRKLEGETVYPMGVALDDWDVLYTKNEFCVAQGNDAKHTFAVDMRAEGGSPVTVSICEGDKRKVVASVQLAPKNNAITAELSDFFLLKDHKSALTIGSKYYLRYNAGGKDFELALQLSTVGAPTGVTAPGSTNVTLDPFNAGSMKPQIEIPGWVPIIGGTNIAVWTPDLPVEVLFNPFGYFKIAYRSEERGYKGKNGEPDPNAWKSHPRKTFEEQANAAWQERENTMKKVGQAKDREGTFKKVEVCKSISFTAMLAAYAAGRWDYQGALWRGSAGIVGTLAFNFTYAQQFFAGPVPMVFEFSFLASLAFGVDVAVSTPEIFTPSKYSLDPGSTGINITLTIMPAISLGVGVRGVLSASVQGMLQFTTFVHYGPLPENIGNRNISKTHVVVGVTAKVNVVIQALIFTTVIPIKSLSKSIPDLYDNWKGDTVKAEAEADVFAEADDWDTVFGTDFEIVPEGVIDEVSEFEVSGWIADEETKKEDGWSEWEYWDDEDAWEELDDEDDLDITWGDGSEAQSDEDNWYFIDDDEKDDHFDGFIYSSTGFNATEDHTGKITAESVEAVPATGEMVPKLVEETTSCTTEDGLPFTMTSIGVEMVPAGGSVAAEAAEEEPAIEQADEAPAETAEQPAEVAEQPAAPDLEAVEGAQAAAASPNEATDASAQSGAAVTAAVAGDALAVAPEELAVAPEELAVEAEEAHLAEDPAAALQQSEDEASLAPDDAVAAQAEPADGEHQATEPAAIEPQSEEAIEEVQEGAEAPVEAEAAPAAATSAAVRRLVKNTNKMGQIPTAASVSRLAIGNGIRPKSDKKLLENVFGDPRAKVLTKVLGTRLFRIASVKVKDEKGNMVSRTRVVSSLLQGDERQVIDFDIRFKYYSLQKDIVPNPSYVPKRSELYDYDFDVTIGNVDYTYDIVDVHFFIISGRRPQNNNTTIAEAASDLVFTHAVYQYNRHYSALRFAYSHLANNASYSATGYNDTYHSFSCPHIEYMGDTHLAEVKKYASSPDFWFNKVGAGCLITFLDRSSNSREDLLKESKNAHVGLGVFMVSSDERNYKFFTVDTSKLLSEETRNDKSIYELVALPSTEVKAVGDGQSSHLAPVLLRGHEKTYYYLMHVSMAGMLAPPYQNYFNPEFKSLKVLNAAYNGDAAKVPRRLVRWPGHKAMLASVDNKLMKVTINGADGPSPSLFYENCGPDTFAISAFGIDESGTFIYWPTTQEGSPGYDYEKNPSEPEKAPALPDIKRHQVLACKLRNGKFSDPFVFAEVDHDMDNLIALGPAQEYSAAAFVSTQLSFDQKTGKPTGKADLWFTSIPNVACITIIGVECLSGVAFPGQPATFYLTARNDGNTYVKKISVRISEKGNKDSKVAYADITPSEASLMESCFNPKGDDGKLQNVEEDYTLAPGKTAVYKVDFVIPQEWSGKKELVAVSYGAYVSYVKVPTVASEGITAEAEEDYIFDDSNYVFYEAGTSEDDWGEEGQPFDIVNIGLEDDNNLADAPITTGAKSTQPTSTPGGSSNNARQLIPRTADDTHSALPLGLAAAGAGFVAYSRRRERLEEEED